MSPEHAHDDAERGISEKVFAVDLPPPPISAASEGPTRINSSADLKSESNALPSVDEKALLEKKLEVVTTTKEVAPAKKKPGPPKPKWKRASRWVRFKLWYNTYR